MEFRIEKDSIGEKNVDKEVYYGVQSLRAYENFRISGLQVNENFIRDLALVKKACAIANLESNELDEKRGKAIIKACDEVCEGKLINQFITDPIQGGAGTSMNMNINEIIANRANEILGYEKGKNFPVHPNDHVNMGQSTNDVIPTAASITVYKLLDKCIKEVARLEKALLKKGIEFNSIIKMGRTEMQDAVPISLGSEFKAFARAIGRDSKRLNITKKNLEEVNLGGTAIGTGITANKSYIQNVAPTLSKLLGYNIYQSENLVDATQNLDKFSEISSQLKVCAINISKLSGDLILMSSGPRTGFGEIRLPAKQNGSSIMPGKVNPVMPELMKQISYQVIGNDVTITLAVQSGQLELNAFFPIIIFNLYQSINILTNGIKTFIDNCIDGIEVNKERCKELVEKSIGIVTALAPVLGYEKSAEIAKKALKTGRYIKEIIKEECEFSENEINNILNVKNMGKIVI
ncbi:aspartate ammonia-lyase [Clostridium aestuarii]|uniref:Aspartate ammonia-lyase n=1 Tax=Clostridium aestuarii TaxID=338193 RepID=A0ABT4D3D1_9CLOT|nr:aspartate ammonia-lyase [Clostridium aestuarii]MCY6485747.1 aspartate ammonia-lyase [Clostridium aestuarii]